MVEEIIEKVQYNYGDEMTKNSENDKYNEEEKEASAVLFQNMESLINHVGDENFALIFVLETHYLLIK